MCCGGRQATYKRFKSALITEPKTINVLLVDSEAPIAPLCGDEASDAKAVLAHLTRQDGWDLSDVPAQHVHLMVQCMEAWIVADPPALAIFYGQHFRANQLPGNLNLENESKTDLADKLERATSDQGKNKIPKGRYEKIRHGSQLLKLIDPMKVTARCPRFGLLTTWLEDIINKN